MGTDGTDDPPDETSEELRQRWRDRLEGKRAELEEADGEERAELVRTLNDLEAHMVEKGFLTADERREYALPDDEGGDSAAGEETASVETGDAPEDVAGDDDGSEDGVGRFRFGQSRADDDPERDTDERGEGDDGSDRSASATLTRAAWRMSGGFLPATADVSGGQSEADDAQSTGDDAETATDGPEDEDADPRPTDGNGSESDPRPGRDSPADGDPADGTPAAEDDTEDESEDPQAATDPAAGTSPTDDGERSPTVDDLQSTVADLEAELADLRREFEEYKRRNERKHDEIRTYSVESFAGNMLAVRDTLQRALELGDWDDADASRLESVVTKFDQQFTKNAVDPIDPDRGTEFDPQYHEAVEEVASADVGAERVVRVERRGFVLADRVIRPAQVAIAARD